jgi:hypothetical protein
MIIDFHYSCGQWKNLAGICLFVLFLFFSCDKNEEINLTPPVTPPLSRGEIGYGVVNVSYTHVVDQPDSKGLSLGYLRRGSVVRVLERRSPGTQINENAAAPRNPWVLVEGRGEGDSPGWLPEAVIDIYSSEAQALTAAESLLQ